MDVSENSGTPKSSILIGCSIITHPFWGTPYFWKYPYIPSCYWRLAQTLPIETPWQVVDLNLNPPSDRWCHMNCWNKLLLLLMATRNPVNSPVDVDSLSHHLQIFSNTSQLVIWDFWTINSSTWGKLGWNHLVHHNSSPTYPCAMWKIHAPIIAQKHQASLHFKQVGACCS